MTGSRWQVVAAIIERDGRFLLGKRSPHKQSAPGVWHAVCGRVEPGESEGSALEREVREETGLSVRAIEKVHEADTRDGRARMHWWVAQPLDELPAHLAQDEHTELRWVSVEEMRALSPTFPEDIELFARWAERAR